ARHRQPGSEQPLGPSARLGPAGHLPEGADGRAHRPHHVSGPSRDDSPFRWGEARREVEEFLLDGERFLRRGEVAERAGVGPEQTARLWSALGFPRIPDDVTAFAQVDLDALALVQELL